MKSSTSILLKVESSWTTRIMADVLQTILMENSANQKYTLLKFQSYHFYFGSCLQTVRVNDL